MRLRRLHLYTFVKAVWLFAGLLCLFVGGRDESHIQAVLARANNLHKKTYSDFRDLVEDVDVTDDKTGEINADFRMRDSRDLAVQKAMCEDDYMIDVRDCSFYPIAGTVVGFFTGGGTIAMGYAAYGYCLYSARKSYSRCMRRIR